MKKLLLLTSLSALLCFVPAKAVAQLDIEVGAAEYVDASHLKVPVKIQNFGSRTEVFVPYGQRASMNIDLDERDDVGIFLRYRPQGRDHFAKRLPSSIVIKTSFGGTIEADAFQSIPSTGASSYQLWEVLFPVSPDGLDVSVNLFGKVVSIRDREGAREREQEREQVALTRAEKADSLVEREEYREALDSYSAALRENERTLSSFAENYTVALYEVGVDELSASSYEEAADKLLEAYRYADEYQLSTKQRIASKLSISYAELGNNRLRSNNFGDALWFYRKARQLDNSNETALHGINAVADMRRSPRKAMLLSVVPGLGQFYNGRYLEGTGFLAGGIFLGAKAVTSLSPTDEDNHASYEGTEGTALSYVGMYAGLAIYSMYRSLNQAQDYNARLFQQSSSVQKYSIAVGPSSQGLNFALRINF